MDKWIDKVRAKREGILFVVSGPSGVGKGTIVKTLVEKAPNLTLSVSTTTRSKRKGETDGVDYHFVDKDKFLQMIEHREFLEYARIHQDEYYGTPRAFVEKKVTASEDVILEIDVQGAFQVRENWMHSALAVLIFVLPPSQSTLETRLRERGSETSKQMKERLQRAAEEVALLPAYDYFIINDDLSEAVLEMNAIIQAERHRLAHVKFEEGGRILHG